MRLLWETLNTVTIARQTEVFSHAPWKSQGAGCVIERRARARASVQTAAHSSTPRPIPWKYVELKRAQTVTHRHVRARTQSTHQDAAIQHHTTTFTFHLSPFTFHLSPFTFHLLPFHTTLLSSLPLPPSPSPLPPSPPHTHHHPPTHEKGPLVDGDWTCPSLGTMRAGNATTHSQI